MLNSFFSPIRENPPVLIAFLWAFGTPGVKKKSWMFVSMDQAWRLVGVIWGRKHILVVYCLFVFLAALSPECSGSCGHFHRGLMENNFEPKILKYKTKRFYGSKVSYKRINYRSNRKNLKYNGKIRICMDVCTYMFQCIHVSLWVNKHVCECMWRPDVDIQCLFH